MESKVFDELLHIEIMIRIVKLSEENYGLLWRIIDRADKRNQYKNDRKWHAAGGAEDGKWAKFEWQVLFIWRMIDQSVKVTNFQLFWFEKSYC